MNTFVCKMHTPSWVWGAIRRPTDIQYITIWDPKNQSSTYINFHGSFILMGLIVPRLTVMKYNECTLYEMKLTLQDSKHFGYMYKCSLPKNRQWQCSIITFVEGEHVQNEILLRSFRTCWQNESRFLCLQGSHTKIATPKILL